jgi:lipid-A-disaccharide synthase
VAEGGSERPLTVMLVVGEPSGDQLGGQLMARLKEIAGNRLRIVGVGGLAMTAQGLQTLFPLDATAVMGLREVVPRIPEILRRVKIASDFALKTRPDLVLLIDSPDFTHRIAQRLKRIDRSIRTANYAPPQVWASRSYRARKMARYIDAVLTLFPFEAAFFERYGIKAFPVGYPVIERAGQVGGGAEFRKRQAIAADAKLLAVLPGSRRNEIRFILPTFKEATALVAREIPGLVTVIPTVPHVASLVREAVSQWPTPVRVVEDRCGKVRRLRCRRRGAGGIGNRDFRTRACGHAVGGGLQGWLAHLRARPAHDQSPAHRADQSGARAKGSPGIFAGRVHA